MYNWIAGLFVLFILIAIYQTIQSYNKHNNHSSRKSEGFWPDWSQTTPELTCIVAGPEGNKYCVRDSAKKQQAAELISRVATNCQMLVQKMFTKFPDNPICIQLHQNFDPNKMSETLPNSEYTAFSENKGEKIAFCLTPKKDNDDTGLIDEHTLTFVAIHELTHVGTSTVGHGDEFWTNFKFLLECAKEFGIHNPVDYKNNPADYCSITIKDNPIYDWKPKSKK